MSIEKTNIEIRNSKYRDLDFWTVFSVKVFGTDFDFFFAENLNRRSQRREVFYRQACDSVTNSGDDYEKQ